MTIGPSLVNNRWYPRATPTSGGPAPGGDALLAVANVAALQVLDDTTIDDGGVVSMKSVLDFWMLNKTDATTPVDNITTVLPNSGVGRWHRLKIPNPYWQLQTTWHISAAIGNDEAAGTALAPLLTWDEYQRRVGEGPLTVSHTVTYDSTLVGDIAVNTACIDDSVRITLQGVRSAAIYSGSVTAKQAQNAGANTDLQITDAALPVSWTASGLVDKLYVLTSGPNAGAAGWVVLDVGGKTARISKAYNEGAGTYVEPAVGETFDVVSLGLVEGALRGIEGGNVRVTVRDLRFSNPGATVFETKGGDWAFYTSDLEGGVVNMSGASEESSFATAVITYATRVQGTSFILNERSTWNWNATYLASGLTMRASGAIIVNADSIVQYKSVGVNYGIRCNFHSRVNLRNIASVGVFDFNAGAGQRALLVSTGSHAALSGYLWGYGNVFDYALEADPHSAIVYGSAVQPVVAGATIRDTLIGNLARNYAALPVTDVQCLAGIIQV
jgi:hypothetical protein